MNGSWPVRWHDRLPLTTCIALHHCDPEVVWPCHSWSSVHFWTVFSMTVAVQVESSEWSDKYEILLQTGELILHVCATAVAPESVNRYKSLLMTLVIIIIIITMTMFMVLSSWHSHCESSPGSFDECRLSAGWLPARRPNQLIWAVSLPIGCYHPQTPLPFIIITQLVVLFNLWLTLVTRNRWLVTVNCSFNVGWWWCCDKMFVNNSLKANITEGYI